MPDEHKRDISRGTSYLPIEDHGIIGDLHTVAFVGNNGTIDWCCIPSFDAPSVFGSLLDAEKGGSFSIAPQDTPETRHLQYYLPETNILITRFLTHDGVGEVTDFMPIEPTREITKRHRIIRAVRAVRGSMTFKLICRPAFKTLDLCPNRCDCSRTNHQFAREYGGRTQLGLPLYLAAR